MNSLHCNKPKPCVPNEPETEIYPPATEAFDFCSGNYNISWDGTRLTRELVHNIPDGTYGTISIVNGCVVGYGECEEPTYTPPYCNPSPSDCQGSTGGNPTPVSISPSIGNTITYTATGLFAKTYIQAGVGVAVVGTGVRTDPYKISMVASDVGVKSVVGRDGVAHSVVGDTTYVELSPTGVVAGSYNGMTVNKYGQVTGVDNNLADGGLTEGPGIKIVDTGDSLVIGHEEWDLLDSVVFGGYKVDLNKSGHITDLERLATVEPGTYRLGAYKVSINEFGGVQSIAQDTEVPEEAGSFVTADAKAIFYDDTGRISKVVDGGVTNPPPLALRDMYRLVRDDTTTATIESYGVAATGLVATAESISLPIPNYVTTPTQIVVNGATEVTINTTTVNIKSSIGQVVTIAFRG